MLNYKPEEKMDIREILSDLESYRPKRRGWTWRKKVEKLEMGGHVYNDCSEPLKTALVFNVLLVTLIT